MSVQQLIDYIRFSLEAEIIKVCPVDKGRLRNSIKVTLDQNELKIIAVDYWKYVEFGTKAHEIKPKNKKALRWNKNKGSITPKKDDIFAKSVWHPGTDPQPFIRNTLYNKLPMILKNGLKKYLPDAQVNLEFK